MGDTFVIVGGDAAGMSAASKAKRKDPSLDVVVFERGEWVSYGACGLPYYVKGEIHELDDLVAMPPETFIEERDIDLRMGHEVTAIDPGSQTVTVESAVEEAEHSYDQLLIATGARAIIPPFDGTDAEGVFTIHDMPHGRTIREFLTGDVDVPRTTRNSTVKQFMDDTQPESVGIIGGGYVGLEMAEAFDAHDLDVHLYEMLPHVLAPFGNEIPPIVEDHLREQDVRLHLETPVDQITTTDGRVTGIEADGGTHPVDMVLIGVGVTPNAELAADAGILLGESGAIATDEYGRTTEEGIFAAGDCAEALHHVTGEPDHVPLALTANRHGRAIGQTVAGDPTPVGPIVGSAEVKVFDLEVARTGVIDPDEAESAGFTPVSTTIEAPSRAHYYPGGSTITIHLVADEETGRLLGASMVGREGVAQRINVIAAAIHNDMSVATVERMDLAYAPPFSPTWDPVLTAARVLNGTLEQSHQTPAADD